MAWDIKDGVGSGPPVSLPKREAKIGPSRVTWWESEPGTAVILSTGGTVDDRWLAYTIRREELAACGIKHAQFSFDQQQLFDPDEYKTRIPIIRPDFDTEYWGDEKHSNDYPFLYFPQRNQILLGHHGQFHTDAMRTTTGFEGIAYGSPYAEPHHPGRIMEDGTLHWYYPRLVGHAYPPNMREVEDSLGDHLGVTPQYIENQEEYFAKAHDFGDDETDWTSKVRKTAAWPDIMAKAKRLIQSGNVTLLRNGYNNVVAHVIGDHGEYQCEISRDDPNSRAITQWTCECPWDQYAFQRTRQWKKYEGRPCAHVLAAYWKSLATPVDDQPTGLPPGSPPAGMPPGGGIATPQGWQQPALPFGQQGPVNMPSQNWEQAPGSEGMVYTGPGGPGGMPMAPSPYGPQLTPALNPIPGFDAPPTGAPEIPGYPIPTGAPHIPNFRIPLNMTPPAIHGPNPSMGLIPMNQFAPPADSNIIPPYPLQEQTLPPPQPVSVPGARPGPYPANPLQQPGTFSRVYVAGLSQTQQRAMVEQYAKPFPDRGEILHQWDDGFHIKTVPTRGDTFREGMMMRNCLQKDGPRLNQLWKTDKNQFHQYSQEPISPSHNGEPMQLLSLRNHNGFPLSAFYLKPESGQLLETLGHANSPLHPKYQPYLEQFANANGYHIDETTKGMWGTDPSRETLSYHVAKAGDEFPPGSAARMEEATLGQSEGREGAYDAGQWMEIPKNAMVEVVSQDQTTGWVEVMYPLKGGPMSSYHVRCFIEPEKLTPLPGSRTPFENPKGRFT